MIKSNEKFIPGKGYSKQDWEAVDSPPLTREQLTQAKPFAEVFPDLAENMRRNLGGRPALAHPKKAINIRLDPDVLAKFKATGKGWQSRINEALKRAKV